MNNRIIQVKKERFIKELNREFRKEPHFSTPIDKIVITKSELRNHTKTMYLETFDKRGDKVNSTTYISSQDKIGCTT